MGLLETFVRRTWLMQTGTYQRSLFGATTFVSYGDVRELVIEGQEALIVKYGDGRRLKVYSLEGDPEAIIEAARSFLDPNLPVITV